MIDKAINDSEHPQLQPRCSHKQPLIALSNIILHHSIALHISAALLSMCLHIKAFWHKCLTSSWMCRMPCPQTFGGYFQPKHDIWIYMTLTEDAPRAGLWLSRDNWKTWRAFDEWPFSNIQRVEFDLANDAVIHGTAFGGSVWRGPATPSGPCERITAPPSYLAFVGTDGGRFGSTRAVCPQSVPAVIPARITKSRQPQPPQARIAALAGVIGCAIDAQEIAAFAARVPKSRGQDNRTPAAFIGAPDQPLVLAAAVSVCCVKQVHPETHRRMDQGDRFRLIAGAVESRHPHPHEPERRNGQVFCPGRHPVLSRRRCHPVLSRYLRHPALSRCLRRPVLSRCPRHPVLSRCLRHPVLSRCRCTQLFWFSTWEALSCLGGGDVCAKRP